MTSVLKTVRIDDSLETAERLMEEYRIRHLPVMDGGNLLGTISKSDIQLMRAARADVHTADIESNFLRSPLTVSCDDSVAEVCRMMIEKKVDCAIVCQNRKLVGIFSWIDGFNLLVSLL